MEALNSSFFEYSHPYFFDIKSEVSLFYNLLFIFFLNIYSIVVSCSMSIRHEANGIPIWVAGGLMGLILADGKIAIRIGNKQGQNNPNDIITGCFVHHLF